MVALWGSKKGDDQDGSGSATPRDSEEARGASTSSRPDYDRRDPDERTGLLQSRRPPPPRPDGYLDPDDPAVSPYNLWSVRFLRYMTIIFLIINFIWWIVLLVSIFVSPPYLHSRGSGFFDFAYTTLTAGNLLVTLLFFSTPSKAMRISLLIIAGLLLVDTILIASIKRLRQEEGWIGIASVIWATVMSVWVAFTDRVVEWGKREEEERLTGRPETRRTLKEWLAVLFATIILIAFAVVVLFMTGTLVLRARDASLGFYGERYYVDGGKYEVHLACIGNVTYNEDGQRNPTVILEAGEDPSEYDLEHWLYSSYENGTVDRYCYWDRPGYAWSDNAPSPHSAGMSADALSEALAIAGEEGPWITVSAGFGSIVSRIFTARHVHDVVGVMMVDPWHEDLLNRIGSPSRGLVLWGYGVISPLGIQRLFGAIFKGRTREDRVYGRSAYQGGKFIKAQLQENLVATSLTRNEVVATRSIISKDIPLVVISSGVKYRTDSEWARKQDDLSKLTDNLLDFKVVNRAPHQVWKTLEGRTEMEKGLAKLVEAAPLVGMDDIKA